ncbi:helix-turn-helix domain-containing protein [Ensifer canadensis]
MPQNRVDEPSFESMIAGLSQAGLSPRDIAHAAEISRVTVWRLANGSSPRPSYATGAAIERLWRAAGCPTPAKHQR